MAQNQKKPTPQSQKEISNSLVKPYDKQVGNPNLSTIPNRGEQISWRGDNTKPFTVGIKDIDEAILYYFQNVIKPSVDQNGERIEVPIIYGSPERWKSFQKDGKYRDKNGKIMFPMIMFKRDSIQKVRSIGNKIDANNPNNFGIFQKGYSDQNAYDNFTVLNNRIPTKEFVAVVYPDYVNVTYSCAISTYYVDQMNKIIEAINYASDSYWGDPERFKFRAMIDDFTNVIETQKGAERSVKTTFNIKLNGYIIPDVVQKSMNAFNKFNEKSKIIFSMEVVENEEFFESSIVSGERIVTQDIGSQEAEKRTKFTEGGVLDTYTGEGGVLDTYTDEEGVLDTYTGASAGYSLRNLKSTTTNVVKIRRSSDNAEQDFTAAQITDGTLLAFTGTGLTNDGFVTIWYDQSGNGNNATQTTANLQPKLVSAGSVILEGGKPTLEFTDNVLNATFSESQPLTSFHVRRYRSTGTYVGIGIDGRDYGYVGYMQSGQFKTYYGAALVHGTSNTTQGLWYSLANGTSSVAGLNGSTTTGNAGTRGGSALSIGAAATLYNAPMNSQELIIYDSNQSSNRSGIESNINTHYTIYTP